MLSRNFFIGNLVAKTSSRLLQRRQHPRWISKSPPQFSSSPFPPSRPCFALALNHISTINDSHRPQFSLTNARQVTTDSNETPTFSSLHPPLHPATLHALTNKLKFTTPTEVQLKSYLAAMSGRDVLSRARTGTGKTLAFLLPAMEVALLQRREGSIGILIVCPTRELAIQIHSQCQEVAGSHSNWEGGGRMTSMAVFGGTPKEKDLKKMESNVPFMLVATPGRLIDHMKTSVVGGVRFGDMMGDVDVLVLDEADRCLDMGFRRDMEFILQGLADNRRKNLQRRNLPSESNQRQTLLFSATLPKDLDFIIATALRKDFATVDCIEDVDPTTHTNALVDQTFVTLPDPRENIVLHDDSSLDANTAQYRWISGIVEIIQDIIHVQNPNDYKLVVFFPTTANTQFFSYIFNDLLKIPVIEIHSRKQQNNRTSSSNSFRQAKHGILFTTDVSARGVDYPDVTHVIQFGSADSRETYIHRLGRTGRAGKKGMGILVLSGKNEERAIIGQTLKGLDVKRNKRYQDLILGETIAAVDDEGEEVNGFLNSKSRNDMIIQKIRLTVGGRTESPLQKHASAAYRSMLGYYSSNMSSVGLTQKVDVVEYANSLAFQMGFKQDNMPQVTRRVAQSIGLVGIPGVNIEKFERAHETGHNGRRHGAPRNTTFSGRDRGYVDRFSAHRSGRGH